MAKKNLYSIKEMEMLTGIKAFTIRMWEKRYEITKPMRTDTNIRRYTEDDLRKISSIAALLKKGFSIRTLANMNQETLTENLRKSAASGNNDKAKIAELLLAAEKFDENALNKIIDRYILKTNLLKTFEDILIPLMQEMENRWIVSHSYPAIKNFVYYVINRKIAIAMDTDIEVSDSSKSFIVFRYIGTPDPIAQIVCMSLKFKGFKVYYAGLVDGLDCIEYITKEKNINNAVWIANMYQSLKVTRKEQISAFAGGLKSVRKYRLGLPSDYEGDEFDNYDSIREFLNSL